MIALTVWSFVIKVMSLNFNTLYRFVIAFLPRSKHLLILWLQSLSAVILEPKKIISVTISTFSRHICHEVMESDAMIFIFWILSFKATFSLCSFHHAPEALVPLAFCHERGIIFISEVVDFSPSNLNSSLWFDSSFKLTQCYMSITSQ